MKAYLRTFGCRANQYDTESMRAMLSAENVQIVDHPGEADVALFNSCAVTAAAEADLRQAIRKAGRTNPALRTIVTGCAAATDQGAIRALPTVTDVIGGADTSAVAALLGLSPRAAETVATRQTGARALLRIQDGCDEHCTFCITTIARGANRSRPIADIIDEARRLAEHHHEIVITGIHIGTYGTDIGTSLGTLVAQLIDAIPDVRFRLSSLEATEVDDTLRTLFTADPRHLTPYLHAPLQSASNRLLKRMGRHWYTAESYADAVHSLIGSRPIFGLAADVICGFPGETEDDHQATLAFIEQLPFTSLHVFPFSLRPGTPAEHLPGHVPSSTITRRAEELRALARSKATAYHRRRVGTPADIVTLGTGSRRSGLTEDYLTVPIDPSIPRGTRLSGVVPELGEGWGGGWAAGRRGPGVTGPPARLGRALTVHHPNRGYAKTDFLMPNRPTVYIETYGCQMNVSDTELMLGKLAATGYEAVSTPEGADVILINTCAIRDHAEQRVVGRVGELKRHMTPTTVMGVTGCMAQRLGPTLLEQTPHVSLVIGPDGYRALPTLIENARRGIKAAATDFDMEEHYEDFQPKRFDKVKAWIPVQRGCDYRCTYCIVPYTRGSERSRQLQDVVREVEAIAAEGVTEVVLLGQTVNSYNDGTRDFADLLRVVGHVNGIRRVRFTSPHPNDFSDRVIEAMAETPTVCEHVHLPMQSGSSRTLKRMLRRYTRDGYVDCVRRLREAIPGLGLTTDIIVGFPGETEEDFEETLSLVREIGFDDAFTFKFSLREGTPAERFPASDTVSDEVASERLDRLIATVRAGSRARNILLLGERREVLVEKEARRGGLLQARTREFKTVLIPGDAGMIGEYHTVELTGTTGSTFTGSIVAARSALPMA